MLNNRIHYNEGVKNGVHQIYNEKGSLIYHAYFNNGVCDSTILDNREVDYEFD